MLPAFISSPIVMEIHLANHRQLKFVGEFAAIVTPRGYHICLLCRDGKKNAPISQNARPQSVHLKKNSLEGE